MSMDIEYIYVNIYTNNIYEYLRLTVKKNWEHVLKFWIIYLHSKYMLGCLLVCFTTFLMFFLCRYYVPFSFYCSFDSFEALFLKIEKVWNIETVPKTSTSRRAHVHVQYLEWIYKYTQVYDKVSYVRGI